MDSRGLPWAIVVGLLLAFVAFPRQQPAPAVDPALYAERDSLTAIADSAIAVADSTRLAHTADSAKWEADRASARTRIAAAQRSAHTLALDLHARLDSTEAAMFHDYEASRDSIDAAADEALSVFEVERASLYVRVGTLENALAATMQELASERAITAQLHTANEALHAQIRAGQQQVWLSRGVATVGVVAALLLK